VEVRPGWCDEKGQSAEVIPGFGLHEVFGCKELWIRERKKTKLFVDSLHEIIPSFSGNLVISGADFEEALEPLEDTAKTLAHFEDGSPAMIINNYGKGKAILIGSLISGTYEQERDTENGKFLKTLFNWASIEPIVDITGDNTECRVMEGVGFKILFGFNHGNKKADTSFHLRVPKSEYRIWDILNQRDVNWSYENGLIIPQELDPQEVCVLKIENG